MFLHCLLCEICGIPGGGADPVITVLIWESGESVMVYNGSLLQVYIGPETHCGVQPGGDGQLRGLRGHAEQSDDQRQHRGGGPARGQQGHVLQW